jgi:copper transporter 1
VKAVEENQPPKTTKTTKNMDHSHHMDMEMDMGGHGSTGHRCQMSMYLSRSSFLLPQLTETHRLFTWNTQDLCLVFRWWHVTSTFSLIVSLLMVVLLGMGYEYLRELSRRYEARVDGVSGNYFPCPPHHSKLTGEDEDDTEESSPLLPGITRRRRRGHLGKALLYGAQVFYSFFIMLLFMTYNGWVMIAVAVGAVLGYLLWGGEASAAKSVACH